MYEGIIMRWGKGLVVLKHPLVCVI